MLFALLAGVSTVRGFGPKTDRQSVLSFVDIKTHSRLFGTFGCDDYGQRLDAQTPGDNGNKRMCTSTDGECGNVALGRDGGKVDEWCMVIHDTTFYQDLYQNGVAACNNYAMTNSPDVPLLQPASTPPPPPPPTPPPSPPPDPHGLCNRSFSKCNAHECVAFVGSSVPTATKCTANNSNCRQNAADAFNPLQMICRSVPPSETGSKNCVAKGYTFCDFGHPVQGDTTTPPPQITEAMQGGAGYVTTVKTELMVLPVELTNTDPMFNMSAGRGLVKMRNFSACTQASYDADDKKAHDTHFFHVICNRYSYGNERPGAHTNFYGTRDSAGLKVRGTRICNSMGNGTTTSTQTTTTTATVASTRCRSGWQDCASDKAACKPADSTTVTAAGVISVTKPNVGGSECQDFCEGAWGGAVLCVEATRKVMYAGDGPVVTCTAMHQGTNPRRWVEKSSTVDVAWRSMCSNGSPALEAPVCRGADGVTDRVRGMDLDSIKHLCEESQSTDVSMSCGGFSQYGDDSFRPFYGTSQPDGNTQDANGWTEWTLEKGEAVSPEGLLGAFAASRAGRVNTLYRVADCTAADGETQECEAHADGGEWDECFASTSKRLALLHFAAAEVVMLVVKGVGEYSAPCTAGTFPGCAQQLDGVSSASRVNPKGARTAFRLSVKLHMSKSEADADTLLTACDASADCYLGTKPYDYVDADGGGEAPFAAATPGYNMSFVFWGPSPLSNVSEGTAVTFVRMRDYTAASSAVDSYADLEKLGLPDPREGMADCKTKYYCLPGPCRVLDMNYFADPSYSTSTLSDSEWVAPSPRNMLRVPNADYSKGNVTMQGRSQCEPTFGTQKVFYKGEVYSPKNVSQHVPNTPAPGSYRYMSTPDSKKPLWPDVLAVPSVWAMPRVPGNNPNPEWMYENKTMWNTPGSERRKYRCEDANNAGAPGLRQAPPVLWLEPVPPTETETENDGGGVTPTMYRVTTRYNKSAFTAAAAFWNTLKGCMVACGRAPRFRSTVDPPSNKTCRDYCENPAGKCSGPAAGVPAWCADMGQEQFAYSYEAMHYWGDEPAGSSVYTKPVQFSPTHVGCQRQGGTGMPNDKSPVQALRSPISPFVAQFLSGTCYRTSDGLHRLPHGVLSTRFGGKHDFAMVTTYPQAAIDGETSHPGVFSAHAQAIGILYPPYLNGTKDTQDAREKLKAMNPFIEWPEGVLLPEWNATDCHVFSSSAESGMGCSLLPHVVPAMKRGCGYGAGVDADLGNATEKATTGTPPPPPIELPPLRRIVQYGMELNPPVSVKCIVTEKDVPCGDWGEVCTVKVSSAGCTSNSDALNGANYPTTIPRELVEWPKPGDTGRNGYKVNQGRLTDAFWGVFVPGGFLGRVTMGEMFAPPTDDAGWEAFEKLHAQWGMSILKVAREATTDVLSTFASNTYSPKCYSHATVNVCHFIPSCMVVGDMWERTQDKNNNCQDTFTGPTGETWWDTRALPSGWYARSRTTPVGNWNVFGMARNIPERSTAGFVEDVGGISGDQTAPLYGFMQQDTPSKHRATKTAEVPVPDVRWWGYGGVGRNPPAYEHIVQGTRLGSHFGFLDVAAGQGPEAVYECSNAFASWEPASTPIDGMQAMGDPGDATVEGGMRAPTGAMECLRESVGAPKDGVRADGIKTAYDAAFNHSTSSRHNMHTTMLTRDTRLLEHLTYVDGLRNVRQAPGTGGRATGPTWRWWLGGTAVSLRATRSSKFSGPGPGASKRDKEGVTNAYAVVLMLRGPHRKRKSFVAAPHTPPVMAASSHVYGPSAWTMKRHVHGPAKNRSFCPLGVVASRADYLENCVLKNGTTKNCTVRWENATTDVVMPEQAICLYPAENWTQHMRDDDNDSTAALPIGRAPLEMVFIGSTLQTQLSMGSTPSEQRDGWKALLANATSACLSDKSCEHEVLRVTEDNDPDPGTGDNASQFAATGTAVTSAMEAAYPGLKMGTSNLGYLTFVNEFEVATFYTGWAPAVERTWSAAVQNSESGSGFACDCNTDVPRFFCERVQVSEAGKFGLGEAFISSFAETVEARTVDVMQCSFGWQRTETPNPIGLYIWSEKKNLEVLQTDIFHGHTASANGTVPHVPLADSLMADGGFTESIADAVTFGGYSPNASHPHVVAHMTYPTTCVRWPYAQVHVNAFTEEGRRKWYPQDWDPYDALMGYCEQYAGKFVHCRRDGMSVDDRTAFCNRNPMASYVFFGVVLRETRDPGDVCSSDRKLCVVVGGYGAASSVAAAMGMVAANGTVLVMPFGKEHLTYAMDTQHYRTIGSTPLHGDADYVSSSALRTWNDSTNSPLGIHSAGDLIGHLAYLEDGVEADAVMGAATRFWETLSDPAAGAARGLGGASEKKVCGPGEVSLPGANNGMESIRCVARGLLHAPITEAEITVTEPGVTLRSGVRGVPMVFSGGGNARSCERIRVRANGFTLGDATFAQDACVSKDVHTHVPVVVVGAAATDMVAKNISVENADVAIAVLGGYTRGGSTITNVSGMRVGVTRGVNGGVPTWCGAFARAVGTVHITCSGLPVLVQSARANVSVDFAPDEPNITNISAFTSVFGLAEERAIYHRATDVSTSVWLVAVTMMVVAAVLVLANILLWTRSDTVLAVIAERMLSDDKFGRNPDMMGYANADFEIYTKSSDGEEGESGLYIRFLQGRVAVSAPEQRAYHVAAVILFTASDCYNEYQSLIDHVYTSLW